MSAVCMLGIPVKLSLFVVTCIYPPSTIYKIYIQKVALERVFRFQLDFFFPLLYNKEMVKEKRRNSPLGGYFIFLIWFFI
jgi:hypothetical protein